MTTPALGPATPSVSTASCAAEPIHIPAAIQPHGVLFVLEEDTYRITQAAATSQVHLGVAAEDALGRSIVAWAFAGDRERFEQILSTKPSPYYNPFKLRFVVAAQLISFDAIVHRYAGHLFLELERTKSQESRAFVAFFQETRDALQRLRQSCDLADLCETSVQTLQHMTGFDRVNIYQFDARWDGKVIAEWCRDGVRPFLGYHFPEGDIPAQARKLYLTSRMRAIPNTHYVPSPIVSTEGACGPPVDMSMAVLRSVSPMHRQYAQSMGTKASMSISLLHEGRLWGLLICAHVAGPKFLSYEVRTACEFICEVFTSLIGAKEAISDRAERRRLNVKKDRLVEQMLHLQDVSAGLLGGKANTTMTEVCDAPGAAICRTGSIIATGAAPPNDVIAALRDWLCARQSSELFVTDRLPETGAPSSALDPSACGVLAAPLPGDKKGYLMWFRPASVQMRTWGGQVSLSEPKRAPGAGPDRSFEAYRQTLCQRSLPWHATQIEATQELVRAIVDIVLQHTTMLEDLNAELEKSNIELNAFAYAASHDLQEPLRGIKHFSQLVVDELGDMHLVGQSRYRMLSIQRMANRMGQLIQALLRYAHVGRAEIEAEPVHLGALFKQVQDTLDSRIKDKPGRLVVEDDSSRVMGDAVLLLEVMTNLVTNAVKYNSSAQPSVHVGTKSCAREDYLELYVTDNGIGIDAKYHETIFDMFRRLHGRDKYGGGSGVGLAIAKRIVERHHARLCLQSVVGQGTTFYFQLPRAPSLTPS